METLTLDISELGPLTDDALYRLCRANRDVRIERTADGTLVVMAPAGGQTGRRNAYLVAQLVAWTQETGRGVAFDSSTGFVLPNGAMRAPDAAWVAQPRWDQLSDIEREQFPPLCPDFVIELSSASDRLQPAQDKMVEWMRNGCRLAWLIDPSAQRAYIYTTPDAVTTVDSFDETLDGQTVLPGFTLSLAPLR
ncbi:MAG: Uma2 family endonuclease [Bacteroidetes bacterium]|jgi:Uma2 family endonuclease|nr:Uma2 family endonuclease [Bacteroidota bacterium]